MGMPRDDRHTHLTGPKLLWVHGEMPATLPSALLFGVSTRLTWLNSNGFPTEQRKTVRSRPPLHAEAPLQ